MIESDAAKRCSDTITLHALFGNAGRWAAIRLSDGGSDGELYDTKADAIRHQFHETLCAYICIPAEAMPVEDADRFLEINRQLYDKGMRLTEPNAPTPVIPQIRRL